MTIEDVRARAEERYPGAWAATLSMPGPKRRRHQKRLRDMTLEAEGREMARAKGGSCETCAHLLTNPSGLRGTFCDLDSDSRGFQQTSLVSVCSRWKKAAAAAHEKEEK